MPKKTFLKISIQVDNSQNLYKVNTRTQDVEFPTQQSGFRGTSDGKQEAGSGFQTKEGVNHGEEESEEEGSQEEETRQEEEGNEEEETRQEEKGCEEEEETRQEEKGCKKEKEEEIIRRAKNQENLGNEPMTRRSVQTENRLFP
jgi:hypothetical protein